MSSSNLNKPSTTAPSGRTSPSRGTGSPSASRSTRTPAAPSTPNGVARTGSIRSGTNGTPISARASVRKPATSSTITSSRSAKDLADEDSRAETNNLIEDLKMQLQRTEEVSSEYEKQIQMLQSRLDDAVKEQGKLEERLHEEEERVEGLENDKRESIRQKRELEAIYEAERAAVIKDKDATHAREEELQHIIQRLKDSLAQKESRPGLGDDGRLSRASSSPSLEPGQFAPPSLQRSNSKNNSKLILQKDKVIESLRLELAEAEIKLVQMENAGGGRLQELERQLLETRMTNARLMEDNESYQLLLSEKTLNGDFARNELLRNSTGPDAGRRPSRDQPSSNLADELSEAVDDEPMEENERIKKLEAEVHSLKDQNKALTLYINKIIERILKHQGGFETILSNTEDDADSGARRPAAPNKDKDLPPPPPKDSSPPPQSLLQRASSVVRRQRPQSMIQSTQPTQASTSQPTVNENPETAPSIPLKRTQANRMTVSGSNRRSGVSDWNQAAAAAVVGNMYRGGDNTPTSPGVAAGRNSFFAFQRTPSGGIPPADIAEEQEPGEARKAALDALTGESGDRLENTTSGVDSPSPPRSTLSKEDRAHVMAGNKPRPLRLVQEHVDEQKQANRSSWLPAGWFGNQS